mmetsp:Transcript_2766/g.8146  ORF Transcript_2766/g.8146 Transcript_2766/m.8146 type:complete len:367 (+) Transcript_2766:244-1344(+)
MIQVNANFAFPRLSLGLDGRLVVAHSGAGHLHVLEIKDEIREQARTGELLVELLILDQKFFLLLTRAHLFDGPVAQSFDGVVPRLQAPQSRTHFIHSGHGFEAPGARSLMLFPVSFLAHAIAISHLAAGRATQIAARLAAMAALVPATAVGGQVVEIGIRSRLDAGLLIVARRKSVGAKTHDLLHGSRCDALPEVRKARRRVAFPRVVPDAHEQRGVVLTSRVREDAFQSRRAVGLRETELLVEVTDELVQRLSRVLRRRVDDGAGVLLPRVVASDDAEVEDDDLVGLKVRESRFDVLQIGCEPLHALILLFGALGVSLAGIHRARVRVAARLSRADGALVGALKQRTESARGVCGRMVREAELYL